MSAYCELGLVCIGVECRCETLRAMALVDGEAVERVFALERQLQGSGLVLDGFERTTAERGEIPE